MTYYHWLGADAEAAAAPKQAGVNILNYAALLRSHGQVSSRPLNTTLPRWLNT